MSIDPTTVSLNETDSSSAPHPHPHPPSPVTHTGRDVMWVLLFIVLGFSLRLSYIRLIDTPPFSDMADYETMAINLLRGQGLVMETPDYVYKAYRPPLYPIFIAGVYRLFGLDPENVRVFQSLISSLSIGLVYLVGVWLFYPIPFDRNAPAIPQTSRSVEDRRQRARRVGLLASFLFMLEETSIFFCGQLLSETLFIFFLLAWSYLLLRSVSQPSLAICTLIGILGGATLLLRPVFGPLFLFGAVWFYKTSKKYHNPPPKDWRDIHLLESPFAPPLVMLIYAGVVVFCWGLRNQAVLGYFVPISTNGGVNLYLGHHEGFGYHSFGRKEDIRSVLRAHDFHDEVFESRFFTKQAIDYITENPIEDMRNNLAKVYYLYLAPASLKSALVPWKWWSYLESPYRPWPWETNRRAVRFWPKRDETGRMVTPTYRDWFWREGRLPLVFWGWPMIYLTLLGMILALRNKENIGFPIGLLAIYTLTLMVYFANARFRTPMLPFLYLFSAYALACFASFCSRGFQRDEN